MRRLRVTTTETMFVDVTDEEGDRLLNPYDYTDVYEAVGRFRRIAAFGTHHIESDVTVEEHTADDIGPYGIDVVHGDRDEQFLWSARHFVGKAMFELSSGRYRQGRCPELDEVRGALQRLEDRLRLMALEVDRPDLPEVQAWRVVAP